MSETITAKDYQMMGQNPYSQTASAKPDTKQLLRMMGDYFELDKKAVNFWIRQMELD
jgi:hypothetical protein